MYQFLDETDIWKLVEKYLTITRMLEEHITKQSCQGKKNKKNMLFLIGTVSLLLTLWSIRITMETNGKAKQE
jgi:hypothetical protein